MFQTDFNNDSISSDGPKEEAGSISNNLTDQNFAESPQTPLIPNNDFQQPETQFVSPIQSTQEEEVVQETAHQEQKDPVAELQQQITELNSKLELQERELNALRNLVGEGLISIAGVLKSSLNSKRIEDAFGNLGSSIKNKRVE
jgi:predicted ribosome quality control (RQC) complex YloA/Tae2 family protein